MQIAPWIGPIWEPAAQWATANGLALVAIGTFIAAFALLGGPSLQGVIIPIGVAFAVVVIFHFAGVISII